MRLARELFATDISRFLNIKKAENTAVAIGEDRKDRKETDASNQCTETVLVSWE